MRIALAVLILSGAMYSSAIGQDCSGCADEQVELYYIADNLTPAPGEEICFSIQVNNFQSVVLFLFSINFSSTSLRLQPNVNTNISGLPSFTASSIIAPFGPDDLDVIRVLWSGPGISGSCLSDSTILMEVCFDVIGLPGEPIQFDINNNGFNGSNVEFISEDDNGMTCPVSGDTPIDGPRDSVSIPSAVVPNCMGVPQVFRRSLCGTQSTFNDGLIELNIECAEFPIEVSLSDGTSFTTSDSIVLLNNLGEGNFTVIVTDALGTASAPFDFTIDQSTPLSVTANIRPPRCEGNEQGSILLSPEGGIPYGSGNYRFTWQDGPFGIGADNHIVLGNGVYPVVIQDSIGCTLRDTFILDTQDPEVIIDRSRDPFCEQRINGQIELRGSGGSPFDGTGYNFVISGVTADGTPVSDASTQTLPGWAFGSLDAGRYVIGIEDSLQARSSSCPLIFSDTITLGYSRNYDIAVTGGDATGCTAGGTARIELLSSDIPASFTYTITDDLGTIVETNSANSAVFQSGCLPGGMYTVSIDDGVGCISDTTFNLIACTLDFIDFTDPPFCPGETGIITIIASSDSLPIRYNWSTGDTTDVVTDLQPGTYDLTITDAANCVIETSIVVDPPEPFDVDFIPLNPVCPDGTGQITATPQGGLGPFEYTWDPDPNGLSGDVLMDIPPGTYNVTVLDDNFCEITASFVLTGPDQPDVTLSNITPPRCEGDNSGAVVVIVTPNANFTGPYEFQSSTGQNGLNNNFTVTNFPSGDNWILITDQPSGCVLDTVRVPIPVAAPLSIDRDLSSIGEVDCFGGSGLMGATVNLVATSPGVEFMWPDGSSTNVQVGLSAGLYEVTLTSGMCLSIDTVVVNQPDSLQLFVDNNLSTFPSCGGSTADIVLGNSGGAFGGLDYAWEDANGIQISTDSFALGLSAGSYVVTATDANGCDVVLPINVTGATDVRAVLDEVIQPLCFGETGVISIDTAFGGAGNYRYQVNTAPALDISEPFEVQPGDYTVRVFDEEACSFDTMITIMTPSQLMISAGSDTEIELGAAVTLQSNVTTINALDTIIWSGTGPIDCSNTDCSDVTVAPIADQLFTVEVTDENGCTAMDDVLVRVVRSQNVFVANVFSPDAIDQRNQNIRINTGAGVEIFDFFRIFDRWGNEVYSLENFLPDPNGAALWDGTRAGEDLEPGVYVYVLQVRYQGEAQPQIRKGDITLIR
ncbi:MAG: gliding motility-associated C-terminal domain-containing protein [Bacteroidota bacterium]